MANRSLDRQSSFELVRAISTRAPVPVAFAHLFGPSPPAGKQVCATPPPAPPPARPLVCGPGEIVFAGGKHAALSAAPHFPRQPQRLKARPSPRMGWLVDPLVHNDNVLHDQHLAAAKLQVSRPIALRHRMPTLQLGPAAAPAAAPRWRSFPVPSTLRFGLTPPRRAFLCSLLRRWYAAAVCDGNCVGARASRARTFRGSPPPSVPAPGRAARPSAPSPSRRRSPTSATARSPTATASEASHYRKAFAASAPRPVARWLLSSRAVSSGCFQGWSGEGQGPSVRVGCARAARRAL